MGNTALKIQPEPKQVDARKLYVVKNHDAVMRDPGKVSEIKRGVEEGDIFIFKNVFRQSLMTKIRSYLAGVGSASFPNYQAIVAGAPNFHRLNINDERAYVKGCFHQFSFFPWNQDLFNLFGTFKNVFQFKNLIGGFEPDKFLSSKPEAGCAARISFQFYPVGSGSLNAHRDPVGYHQLTVPIIMLSTKFKDYKKGGAYAITASGKKIDMDEKAGSGDVVYINAQVVHGIDPIDPGKRTEWTKFQGRWAGLCAVNRFSDNTTISNATDLGKR
jgi:hypothetical protein